MLRTVRQQKNLCDNCPLAKAANLIGDVYVLLIVRDLLVGPKRFGDLHESLKDVSSRTLSLKLKLLEKQKIIERLEYKEKPPRVEYRLTKKGIALEPVSMALRKFGTKYL